MTDHQAFFNRLDAAILKHESEHPDMGALARAHNLTVDHTGGGCLAYALHEADGWYFWLTSDDGGSLPDSPDEANCFGGWNDNSGDFLTCAAGTPRDLLSVVRTLGAVSRLMCAEGENYKNTDDLPLRSYLEAAQERGLVHPDERLAVSRIIGRPVARLNADSLGCEESLRIAQEALVKACGETDTASPEGHRYRLALATVEAILMQRGCGADEDQPLTTIMNEAIFG
jgi:hypothetical protein